MMAVHDTWYSTDRLGGLRRFAIAITLLNLLGHTVLGFEQSWAQPLVALATAYSMELLLEVIEARSQRRTPRFLGSLSTWRDFLLSAHISALAVAMLTYASDRLWPVAFAAAVAIGSKILLRAPVGTETRHIFNPSNFGITVMLLAFPWVGIAPPYQFTEALSGAGDWLLPGLIIVTGSLMNARFTRRWPLIIAWLSGFVAQAILRSVVFGTPTVAGLLPMTGMAFLLYTFYMVTDPATTPSAPRAQVAFGLAVAATYGCLMLFHVVFGLFFALTIVCTVRALILYGVALNSRLVAAKGIELVPASIGRFVL